MQLFISSLTRCIGLLHSQICAQTLRERYCRNHSLPIWFRWCPLTYGRGERLHPDLVCQHSCFQIEPRVLTRRGPDAYAASLDLPSRLIACSSGRSQWQ